MLQRFEQTVWVSCILLMTLFAAQCRADLIDDVRAKYPMLIEKGDIKGLSSVPLNSSAAQAATSSKHAWIIAQAGVASNSPYLRIVRVDAPPGGSQYYIVREGGFGMAEILVYGPLDLSARVEQSKPKQ